MTSGDIILDLDPRNTGQFFACCGVLELAGRIWPESEGWFREGEFHVVCGPDLDRPPLDALIRMILTAEPLVRPTADAGEFSDRKVAPLTLVPFDMRLDWWLASGRVTASILKLWSGNQTPLLIATGLQAAFRRVGDDPGRDLLRRRQPMTGRFGFDPAAAWEALDVGFSPNEQSTAVLTAPASELLAAVGLQGFRPGASDGRRNLEYATWNAPLPTIVARAAASGVLGGQRFRFPVLSRGKYKAFGFAEEIEEDE